MLVGNTVWGFLSFSVLLWVFFGRAVKVSIQGDARLSYFLSAVRKDLVNANEVSLLPLYILAIGPWSLQRKNEPLQYFFLCQINELFEGFKYLSSLFHHCSSPSLLIVSLFIMFDHYIDKALLLDFVAAFICIILKAHNYAGLLKNFLPMYLWAISFILLHATLLIHSKT